MATFVSIQDKLLDIIDRINTVTGLEDSTVNTAVDSALKLKIEEAYGKSFSRFPLEEDKMYAIGYNWFAAIVALAQQMSYINRDLTPEEILAVLGRVEYYPHIFTEQDIEKFSTNLNMLLKELVEDVKVETQKPITGGYITEPIRKFSTGLNMKLVGLKEEISCAPIIVQNVIITHEDITMWNYNPRYVTLNADKQLVLQTQWNYNSIEESIDQGRMTVVKAITNDLASVEEVTVSG